jgi:signal transduction histidine kinase
VIKLSLSETYVSTIRDPRFWIIAFIMVALFIFYQSWPWKNFYDCIYKLAVTELNTNTIGSLFLIPIILSTLLFRWRGTLITWTLSAIAISPLLVMYSGNVGALLRNIAFLLFPVLVVLIIAAEIDWHRREMRNLQEREREQKSFILQIARIQEEERTHIAQELHDDTVQTLLAIANHAQALASDNMNQNEAETRRNIEHIRDEIVNVSKDVRKLSFSLRPYILDDMGLIPALRSLADNLQNEGNIDTEFLLNGKKRKLRSEVEVNALRIVQEALNNVKRHSKASRVSIHLTYHPEYLEIDIKDNGIGFPMHGDHKWLIDNNKLGLIGIEQRTKFLGGKAIITPKQGKGTTISIELPY